MNVSLKRATLLFVLAFFSLQTACADTDHEHEHESLAEHACKDGFSKGEEISAVAVGATGGPELKHHKPVRLKLQKEGEKYVGDVTLKVAKKSEHDIIVSDAGMSIKITDSAGKEIKSIEKESVNVKNCSAKLQFETPDLEVGTYTISISGASSEVIDLIYFYDHDHDHDHEHGHDHDHHDD